MPPSTAELRSVCHPPGLLDRRSGEHWAGRLYMRHVSLQLTRVLVGTPVTPNQLTLLMLVVGVAAGPALLVPGLAGAVLAALLAQLALLLDCSDGEVARWTGRTSLAGIYLDRVGHYFGEAALLVGLGFRASAGHADGWAVLGLAAALGAILIKSETDLVDTSRARAGMPATTEAASEVSAADRPLLARARKVALVLRFHRVLLSIELSLLLVGTAVVDAVRGDLAATRILTVVVTVVAAVQVVLHLVSILVSRRLR